jgi:hypothetical protein
MSEASCSQGLKDISLPCIQSSQRNPLITKAENYLFLSSTLLSCSASYVVESSQPVPLRSFHFCACIPSVQRVMC